MTSVAKPVLSRSDRVLLAGGGLAFLLTWLTARVDAGPVLPFVVSAVAVAVLAALVGRSVEQLGDRFGPGATGVLQSALGNLPELFIALFALRAGLVTVVQAALIGSILANLLLVLGLSFLVGGLRHGRQRLDSQRARSIIVLMVLSVAAMVVPSLASYVHAPAEPHEDALSVFVAAVLLVVFVVTLPASLRRERAGHPTGPVLDTGDGPHPTGAGTGVAPDPPHWPAWLALALLAAAALAAAFVSDWFVAALEPAMATLNISQAFAGLVVVAIAGNAVENVVGVQLAAAGRSEYAFSVVVNSPMQIALVLAPVLVIASHLLGFASLTLVFPPMLVIAVVLAVFLAAVITFDGESTWAEGATLIGLYAVIAASFWWG